MTNTLKTHERRVRRSRSRIQNQNKIFMSVFRTPNHIYAQVFSPRGASVLAQASSLDPTLRKQTAGPGKIKMAEAVGKLVAERAKAKGVEKIAFDRSGYKYHGRIKALADAARANGLEF